MELEVDVSGEDLLSKDYTVCIASKDEIIRGFKFNEELINILSSRYGQGFYKYPKSKNGKALFKVRVYSVVIYYLVKSLKISGDISLNLCRDFYGREEEIKKNLLFFIEKILGLSIRDKIYFRKLEKDSNAHKYAYLMRHDNKNKLDTYITISLEEIEKWIKK